MLKITNQAVRVLKATARSKEGASDDAGIRIRRDAVSPEDGTISVGLDVCDGPESGDAELQQDGLHIFVEDALREPLEGRTLDVRIEEESPRFISYQWRVCLCDPERAGRPCQNRSSRLNAS